MWHPGCFETGSENLLGVTIGAEPVQVIEMLRGIQRFSSNKIKKEVKIRTIEQVETVMDALGQEEHYKYSPKRELLQKHVPEVLLSGRVGRPGHLGIRDTSMTA